VENVSVDEFLVILPKAKEILKNNKSKFTPGICETGEGQRFSINEIYRMGRGGDHTEIRVYFASSCPELGGRSLLLRSPAAKTWEIGVEQL
jgi:hypothetical protein